MTFIEKLNDLPIDWCFNCAVHGYKEKDSNHQMFTFILIQYLKGFMRSTDFSFYQKDDLIVFEFTEQFFKIWDCVPINKHKYNPRYYKGILQVLERHLAICQDTHVRKVKIKRVKNSIVFEFK